MVIPTLLSVHPIANTRNKVGIFCIITIYVMKYCHGCLKIHLVVSDRNCNIVTLYRLFKKKLGMIKNGRFTISVGGTTHTSYN